MTKRRPAPCYMAAQPSPSHNPVLSNRKIHRTTSRRTGPRDGQRESNEDTCTTPPIVSGTCNGSRPAERDRRRSIRYCSSHLKLLLEYASSEAPASRFQKRPRKKTLTTDHTDFAEEKKEIEKEIEKGRCGTLTSASGERHRAILLIRAIGVIRG